MDEILYTFVAVKGEQIHEVAGVTGWAGVEQSPGLVALATQGGATLFVNTSAWDIISFEPDSQ